MNDFREKCFIKTVAGSDPAKSNQFNVSGTRSSVGYLNLTSKKEEEKRINEFFNGGKIKIVLNTDNIKSYCQKVKKFVTPYKEFYLDNLETFYKNYNGLVKLKKLELDGFEPKSEDAAGRVRVDFYKKDDEDNLVSQLKGILLGNLTKMIFYKPKEDYIQLDLDLVENIQEGLFLFYKKSKGDNKKNFKLDKEKVRKTFNNYQNQYQDEKGIIKFSIDYSLFINNGRIPELEEAIGDSKTVSKIKNISQLYNDMYNQNNEMVDDLLLNDESEPLEENEPLILRDSRASEGYNEIYYGIPGCGKSYTVDKEIEKYYKKIGKQKGDYDQNVFRTTFYLDYTNTDFIGQLIPSMDQDGNVIYAPKFGPFTRALKRSYETDDMVFLVIEELNRGNAAAIFGDLFQLLDRLDETKAEERNDGSKPGDSEYPITNKFLEDYLHIPEGKVIIPSNLTIFATMNTSDQNVFPLDTAFQRRWKKCKVKDKPDESVFADYYVPNKNNEHIKWKNFLKNVNAFMLESDEGEVNEDKQIGAYFLTDNVLIDPESIPNEIEINDGDRTNEFNHKIIEYLWDDVAKFDRERWFNNPEKNTDRPLLSFDDLIDCINNYGMSKVINPVEEDPKNKKDTKDNEDQSADDGSEENMQNESGFDANAQTKNDQEDDMNGE